MIYIDEVGHMCADKESELHLFARRLRLKREWYQDKLRHRDMPHYDLTTPTMRRNAQRMGAQVVSFREILTLVKQMEKDGDPRDTELEE